MQEVKEEAVKVHKTSISIIEAIPAEIDAGADILLKARVLCTSSCNLQGGRIRIIDPQGDVVTEVDLPLSDGTSKETDEFTVKAPIMPRKYTWTAVFPAQQKEGILHQESSAQFSFNVKPHLISLSVWGIPLPVSKGEKFKVEIGAKCSAGCSLASLPFVIEDGNNKQVAAGKLGEEVLPQTNGIYWTEQELNAPADEALHKWVAKCITTELEWSHQTNLISFSFRTAMPPEHTVTIEVTNKNDKTPINNAYVMLGLHKASTDRHGIARVEVPGGKLELCVTKIDYLSFQTTVEITGDATVKVELVFFPES